MTSLQTIAVTRTVISSVRKRFQFGMVPLHIRDTQNSLLLIVNMLQDVVHVSNIKFQVRNLHKRVVHYHASV